MSKNAKRRHHRERLKNKRKYHWGGRREPLTGARLSAIVTTVTICSGWCCGNPRKWFNQKTMQERRFECVAEDEQT